MNIRRKLLPRWQSQGAVAARSCGLGRKLMGRVTGLVGGKAPWGVSFLTLVRQGTRRSWLRRSAPGCWRRRRSEKKASVVETSVPKVAEQAAQGQAQDTGRPRRRMYRRRLADAAPTALPSGSYSPETVMRRLIRTS